MRHGPSTSLVQTLGDISQESTRSDRGNVCGLIHGKLLEMPQVHNDSSIIPSESWCTSQSLDLALFFLHAEGLFIP